MLTNGHGIMSGKGISTKIYFLYSQVSGALNIHQTFPCRLHHTVITTTVPKYNFCTSELAVLEVKADTRNVFLLPLDKTYRMKTIMHGIIMTL